MIVEHNLALDELAQHTAVDRTKLEACCEKSLKIARRWQQVKDSPVGRSRHPPLVQRRGMLYYHRLNHPMVVRRESGGEQPQPTAAVAGRDPIPPSSELSVVDGRKQVGRTCCCRRWKVQQQLRSYDGSMVVGRELVGSNRSLPMVQQGKLLYRRRRSSPIVTTAAGRVSEELGQPIMSWRRLRF